MLSYDYLAAVVCIAMLDTYSVTGMCLPPVSCELHASHHVRYACSIVYGRFATCTFVDLSTDLSTVLVCVGVLYTRP